MSFNNIIRYMINNKMYPTKKKEKLIKLFQKYESEELILEENKEADIKSLQRLFNRYNTNREKHITLNIILYSIDISLEKAEDSDINILNLYFSIENNFAAAIQRYNGCKANLKYLNLEEFPYSIVR